VGQAVYRSFQWKVEDQVLAMKRSIFLCVLPSTIAVSLIIAWQVFSIGWGLAASGFGIGISYVVVYHVLNYSFVKINTHKIRGE
jgi:hypothetical protein